MTHSDRRAESSDRGEPYPLAEPDLPLRDLVSQLTSDVGEMVRAHIELAKTEIKQEAAEAGVGAGLFGMGGLAGWIAALILSLAAAWGLAELFNSEWAGLLIVGLVWTVIAGVLALMGRSRLKDVKGLQQTQRELKEDRQWLREQTS